MNKKYWSLNIGLVAYDNDIVGSFSRNHAFAVIDTGTTMVGIPDKYFKPIRDKWQKTFKDRKHLFLCNDMVLSQGFC